MWIRLPPRALRNPSGHRASSPATTTAGVQALGFRPTDDNEADALALLHWAIAQKIGGAR
jgi:hypothetical protein